MKIIKISSNDVDKRIDNFLNKLFVNLSKSNIYKLIRKKLIKVNNQKVEINYRLKYNDSILLCFDVDKLDTKKHNLNFLNAKDDLDIIFEDNNIIIVNKTPQLVVYDEKNIVNDTLINRIKKYLYKKQEYIPENENVFEPSLAHRIDLNTSGIVIAAKNAFALADLNYIFKNKLIQKFYLTLVHNKVLKKQDTINCFIKKLNNNMVTVSGSRLSNDYKLAITKYKLINFISNKYSLLEVNLITGKTHQIRATMNFIKYPIVGEKKYINKNINKDDRFDFQCLVSYKIKFDNLSDTKILNYLSYKEFKMNNIWFLNKLNIKFNG